MPQAGFASRIFVSCALFLGLSSFVCHQSSSAAEAHLLVPASEKGDSPVLFGADNTTLYWTEGRGWPGEQKTTVRSVPKSGGAVSILASMHSRVERVRLCGSGLCWLEDEKLGMQLVYQPTPGVVMVLESSLKYVDWFRAEGSYLYWLRAGPSEDAPSFHRVPLAGGRSQPVVRGMSSAEHSITMDADQFYVAESDGKAYFIVAAARMGGMARRLALLSPETRRVTDLMADSSYLYWIKWPGPALPHPYFGEIQ